MSTKPLTAHGTVRNPGMSGEITRAHTLLLCDVALTVMLTILCGIRLIGGYSSKLIIAFLRLNDMSVLRPERRRLSTTTSYDGESDADSSFESVLNDRPDTHNIPSSLDDMIEVGMSDASDATDASLLTSDLSEDSLSPRLATDIEPVLPTVLDINGAYMHSLNDGMYDLNEVEVDMTGGTHADVQVDLTFDDLTEMNEGNSAHTGSEGNVDRADSSGLTANDQEVSGVLTAAEVQVEQDANGRSENTLESLATQEGKAAMSVPGGTVFQHVDNAKQQKDQADDGEDFDSPDENEEDVENTHRIRFDRQKHYVDSHNHVFNRNDQLVGRIFVDNLNEIVPVTIGEINVSATGYKTVFNHCNLLNHDEGTKCRELFGLFDVQYSYIAHDLCATQQYSQLCSTAESATRTSSMHSAFSLAAVVLFCAHCYIYWGSQKSGSRRFIGAILGAVSTLSLLCSWATYFTVSKAGRLMVHQYISDLIAPVGMHVQSSHHAGLLTIMLICGFTAILISVYGYHSWFEYNIINERPWTYKPIIPADELTGEL